MKSKVKEIFKLIDKKLGDEQVFFVNFHPILKDSISLSKYKHIKPFPKGIDNYSFLNCADALVTDYSSVFFDYSLTKKPIILFMYDYDEYMHDRGMYMDVATLPFRKIYDEKELAKVLGDESFMNDSYEDTEYFKTFFKYDSPDISEKLLNLMFTGEQGDLAIQDYSANKEKRYKVIHPQIVKEYAHLNSISKIAKDDNIVCFEKKWFKGEVGPALYDNFNDMFKYVVVTMTTPRSYFEDLLCHLGVKSVKDAVHKREIQRTFPNLNIDPKFIDDISAFEENCFVDDRDIVRCNTKSVSNSNRKIAVSLNAKGYDFEEIAVLNNKRVIQKTLPLTEENKQTKSFEIPLDILIENLIVYNKQKYTVGVIAYDKKKGKKCLVVASIKKAKDGDISKRFCEPLFANYTLPKAYFDTDLKKLVDANNDRTKKMLKLYDLTPTVYEIAASPFYDERREFNLYFGKKEDALEAIYPPCKLKSLKTKGNRLELVFNIPNDQNAEFDGLVLKYRSVIENIEIPFNCNLEKKEGYTKVTATLDFNGEMPLKEIYWDVRAVVEKYGAKQYVKLGYSGIAIKQKLYFSNVQCDVDDKHIIFPYFNKKGIINFCFRERSEYDTAEIKRREVLAYILYILTGLFLSHKKIWIVYEKFCKMAQDNGYYFFKYCMENLDEKEKKNIYYIIDKRSDEYKKCRKIR